MVLFDTIMVFSIYSFFPRLNRCKIFLWECTLKTNVGNALEFGQFKSVDGIDNKKKHDHRIITSLQHQAYRLYISGSRGFDTSVCSD